MNEPLTIHGTSLTDKQRALYYALKAVNDADRATYKAAQRAADALAALATLQSETSP